MGKLLKEMRDFEFLRSVTCHLGCEMSRRDDMEALAYVSGVLCQFDMGLCLLPLARESAWLNTACVAYPEGIPFHRITGWWCVIQTVVHSVAEVLAVMTEAAEEYAAKPLRQCPTCLEWKKDFALGGTCFSCPYIFVRHHKFVR